MRSTLVIGASIGLFIASTSMCSSQTQSGIEGVITLSPSRPGQLKKGSENEVPLAEVSFVVANSQGAVKSFTTDKQGRFRISLDPGHYTVTRKEGASTIGSYGPFEVDVTAGNITKVEWR